MKLLFLYFLCWTVICCYADDRECVTPNGSIGVCVPFKDCSKIYRKTSDPEFLASPEFVEELKARKCSTQTKKNHICCDPFDDIYCGLAVNFFRIKSGANATLYQFPWLALLEYADKIGEKTFECTGSLITKNFVISAGHCLKKNLVSVRLGEHQIGTDPDCEPSDYEDGDPVCAPLPQDIPVESTIIHPGFSKEPGAPNDIGLIRLSRPAVLGASVNTICLPIRKLKEEDYNTRFIVAGYGMHLYSETSDILKYAHFQHEDCSNNEVYPLFNKDKQFCALAKSIDDSCVGEGGGPLSIFNPLHHRQQIQIGISSAGPQCEFFKVPRLYTKVESHIDWILENVNA